MEISGAVLGRTPAISGVRPLRDSAAVVPPSMVGFGRRAAASARPVFSDAGHLKYYASPLRCGSGRIKKEEKKRAKLIKGLSKDLASLCSIGIGADAAEGLAAEVKGKMIMEAAELLMAELKQLKAQSKEMKRKLKEQKAAKKASMMKDCAAVDDSSSSSSSSDSSDDECCNEVVRMRNLRTPAAVHGPNLETLPLAASELKTGEVAQHHIAMNRPQQCSNNSISASIGCCSSINSTTAAAAKPTSKIEVCMGGKCKRSGAMQLMEEFNKKLGREGAVVGCKCMGKCRDGPNVRVVNHSADATAAATGAATKNPLCLGVGLEDVGAIVANFFGEKDVGLIAA
ncbi:hypothetical protein Cni_G27188 [Canna indica]|uniref:Diacylglycerol O-acyltransferase 3, cytosolic n=1 Tax=Canna indica TaxID=4628 RepID=A0AAQ3L0A2_9LILI|nr:hypothetical protein Cni_G27188 [Canna indica]